ncbi:hypothetical protein HFO24_21230 [Rhizobium laguerreae]|uniref:hypothetical protein n=1 Tax=Rhizobium laguerreae TaxID=1076926 RepID=UPI001C8FBF0F|nr:hypothetical protein [Rhizobium laguerreae]MBY3184168.1 hypothetical protein [Rhizobium laguerreae]
MGTTIANPENIQAELEKLKSFYEAQQKILLDQQEEAERIAAEKREAEAAVDRDKRYGQVAEQAKYGMEVAERCDRLCAELSAALRERVEVAREIRRIAPDHPGVRAMGNTFEHRRIVNGGFVAANLHSYAEMSPRGGRKLADVDAQFLLGLIKGAA